MEKLKLGQKIWFDKMYVRYIRHSRYEKPTLKINRYKYWNKQDIKKQKGIVVGLRTLSNGNAEYWQDEGYIYERKESVKAVLVSTSLRAAIIKVPLEDVIIKYKKGK
jgi:hypothetical protein